MLMLSATEVRNEWSTIMDGVIRKKPSFIKRTRDCMMLSNLDLIETLLEPYNFTANIFIESDNSITLSLNELDLIENAETEEKAKLQLAGSIIDYAEDYYNEFEYWSSAKNRKTHLPYVLKALILNDKQKIGDLIKCQLGEN